MNRFNWGAALSAGGGAAQDASRTTMQRDIAEMQAARAENLARLQFAWKAQHDTDMLNKQLAHDTDMQSKQHQHDLEMAKLTGDIETQREGFEQHLRDQDLNDYNNRYAAAQKFDLDRETVIAAAGAKGDQQRAIGENQVAMREAISRVDEQTIELQKELEAAVNNNPLISGVQDPDQRHQAMARDPVIGPMLQQLSVLGATRADTMAHFAIRGNALGDPYFVGLKTLPGQDSGGGTQSGGATNTQPSGAGYGSAGGGTATPSNSSSASGTPPLSGQLRPPTRSYVGPLGQPPQLIPSAANAAGRTIQSTPSLIPQSPPPGVAPPMGMGMTGMPAPTGGSPTTYP